MLARARARAGRTLLREHDDRAALRRLVGERGELRHLGELALVDAGAGTNSGGLAVAERDRAGLVEQEHVDVAGGLDRAPRHREHVALHEPVHPGDADRGEQRADRGRDQRDEERDQHGLRGRRSRVDRVGPQRDDGGEEGDRQPGEQDVERDLVRRLAPLGALDERDHPVEERLARLLGHLDHEPVGEQPRAAGDAGAVAAGLADHRRRLAGDRRLVDRADTLDDLAVGGDDLARLDDHDVALLELGRRDLLDGAVADIRRDGRGRARRAQRVRLRLAPALGDRLGEVREQHGQPQPERDHADEPELARVAARELEDEDHRRDHAAELDDEHHRVLELQPRVELRERVADRGEHELAREDAGACLVASAPAQSARRRRHHSSGSSSARLSSSTLTPGSPKKPQERPSVFLLDQLLHGRERQVAHRRDPARLERALAGEMSGSMPEPDVVTASTGMSWIVRPGLYGRSSSRIACAAAFDVLGEVGVRRPEVGEGRAAGVVGGRGRRRALVEVARARERLRGELRADDLAVALDQAAVRLVRERHLGEAGHHERVAEAEERREHDDREDRARRGCASVHQPFDDRAEGEGREDHQARR